MDSSTTPTPMQTSSRRATGLRLTVGIVALVSLAAGCNSSSEPTPVDLPSNALSADTRGRAVVTDSLWPADAISIDSVHIDGDTLIANVTHGGGCRTHDYKLVVGTAWMESFPVQAPGRMSHDAHGDLCKALIRRELRISLTPIADAYRMTYNREHGTVSLVLKGSSSLLWYMF
jgi:hypothetical protein